MFLFNLYYTDFWTCAFSFILVFLRLKVITFFHVGSLVMIQWTFVQNVCWRLIFFPIVVMSLYFFPRKLHTWRLVLRIIQNQAFTWIKWTLSLLRIGTQPSSKPMITLRKVMIWLGSGWFLMTTYYISYYFHSLWLISYWLMLQRDFQATYSY